LILLYGDHCFSVRLPSNVMLGLLHHIIMHLNTSGCFLIVQQLLNGIWLCAVIGIDGTGLGASKNGAYWQSKMGVAP